MFRDRAIIMLAAGQTLSWASLFYIFPALLLRWEHSLGWSKLHLTAAITLAVLISAMMSPLAGRFIDSGRGAHMMAVSAILGGSSLLFLSSVTALWQFYAVWLMIGIALAGCLYDPCFALVVRARGKEAKSGIIIITLIAGFASTICFPTMHAISQAFGWRVATNSAALVAIIIVAPLLWFGTRTLEGVGANTRTLSSSLSQRRNAFLKTRIFWFLALGFACGAIVHGAVLHHLLALLAERDVSTATAVLIAALFGPMQVAGRMLMMLTAARVSHHAVAILAFILMGSAVVILIFSGALFALLLTFMALFGGAYGTVSIIRPLIARDILGEMDFGAKSGALAVPYLMGVAVAPYLGSLLWSIDGYDTMLLVLVVLQGLGFTLYLAAHYGSAKLV